MFLKILAKKKTTKLKVYENTNLFEKRKKERN
jgi:hypothetical protein